MSTCAITPPSCELCQKSVKKMMSTNQCSLKSNLICNNQSCNKCLLWNYVYFFQSMVSVGDPSRGAMVIVLKMLVRRTKYNSSTMLRESEAFDFSFYKHISFVVKPVFLHNNLSVILKYICIHCY